MSRNNLYTLIMDDSLDENFQKMQNRFKKGEKIISTKPHGKKLLVTTETPDGSDNLLLDDLRAGRLTQFGRKRS